jgi:hypothetical protein
MVPNVHDVVRHEIERPEYKQWIEIAHDLGYGHPREQPRSENHLSYSFVYVIVLTWEAHTLAARNGRSIMVRKPESAFLRAPGASACVRMWRRPRRATSRLRR